MTVEARVFCSVTTVELDIAVAALPDSDEETD